PADAKRVSYPTITPREGSSCFNTYDAIAPATRRTFSKVKSSAMIARQPSVPNLMAAAGRRSSVFGNCGLTSVVLVSVTIRPYSSQTADDRRLKTDDRIASH